MSPNFRAALIALLILVVSAAAFAVEPRGRPHLLRQPDLT